MAAVLACGEGAALSHASASALWRIRTDDPRAPIEVSLSAARRCSHADIVAHRRKSFSETDIATKDGIPVTSVICTLTDLAPRFNEHQIDAMLNEADKLDLINWDELQEHLERYRAQRRPGAARLLNMIEDRLIVLTDSELERMFLRISRAARLAPPQTGVWLNGWKTDFYWPDHKLVVEADSLRHHRTAAQQTRDRERDQAHLLAGLIPLRFTHAQIKRRPSYVAQTIATVAGRNVSPA